MGSLEPLVKTHLDGRRVRLEWKRPGAGVCLCDRHGFAQAALNLILNAAEAVEGRPEAVVRIEARCDAKWVYLVVEDSGPGVPAEIRERIFDPFFTTKSPGKGTGLGLPVSRRLIRTAGGDVELAPEPSPLGGALFVLRLPRADGTSDYRGWIRPKPRS
jgi:C4-dicarboxylate-specific signal transduction histidine kinase